MTFDPTAPVLAILTDPRDDEATIRPMALNAEGEISRVIGGALEAIELDGGSVLWFDESGKNRRLATNLLATKIAHKLHTGLVPNDTINGRALIVGEAAGPSGDLVSTDVSQATLIALGGIGVSIVPG